MFLTPQTETDLNLIKPQNYCKEAMDEMWNDTMGIQAAASSNRKFYRKNDRPQEVDPETSSWVQVAYLEEKGSTHREMGKEAGEDSQYTR